MDPLRSPGGIPRIPLAVLLLAGVVACAEPPAAERARDAGQPGDAGPRPKPLAACSTEPLTFRTAVPLNARGYEPSIEIDTEGTIFVTAHALTPDPQWLSSWLWRSLDDGFTFEPLAGPVPRERMFAFEGDLALDANDKLYFMETYAPDSYFYRYGDRGAKLELFRAGAFTYEVDDRPWITAHHDGVLYYLTNTGYKHDGRLTVHISTDGGETIDPVGYTFPKSGWGFLDADPNSDHVYAVMNDVFYGSSDPVLGNADSVYAWISPDRGATWEQVKIADYEFGYQLSDDHDDAYPVVAVSPVDGSVVAVWTDDGKKIKLARSVDRGRTWAVHDITPFDGLFSFSWVTVGPTGDVGVIFQANPATLPDTPQKEHYIYGMVWRPHQRCRPPGGGRPCEGPGVAFARMHPTPTGTVDSQADFFQVEMSADNALNVSYTDGTTSPTWQLFFTKQEGGPNLGDQPFCGMTGTP